MRTTHRRLVGRVLLSMLGMVLIPATVTQAQLTQEIAGLVRDSSGAVLPGLSGQLTF